VSVTFVSAAVLSFYSGFEVSKLTLVPCPYPARSEQTYLERRTGAALHVHAG
jgi:hypothetical protein